MKEKYIATTACYPAFARLGLRIAAMGLTLFNLTRHTINGFGRIVLC